MAYEHDSVEFTKPYNLADFANKHGLTPRVAELLLLGKEKRSRAACDAAALAFLNAVAMHAKRQPIR